MEQEDPVRRRRPGSIWSRYWMTLDQRGFHIHLNDVVGVRGPFSSLSGAWRAAEIEALITRQARLGVSYHPVPVVHTHRHRLVQEEDLADHHHAVGFTTSDWRIIYDDDFLPPDAPEHTRIEPMQQETFMQLTPRRRWDWEYHLTLRGGLFYAHPPDISLSNGYFYLPPPDAVGPFHTLSEAITAIRSLRNWATSVNKLRTSDKEYYFILKDGLFRAYPDGVGGPFKFLDDATDALARYHAWELEQEENYRQLNIFMAQADPAVYRPQIEALIDGLIRSSKSEPRKLERKSSIDEFVDSLYVESGPCDPAILQEADRLERIEAEKESIKNGMNWMESEVLQAFEIYKRSSCYQGPKYEFVKLDHQCLIHDDSSKSYHHYNFTMKKKSSFYLRKKRGNRSWDYQLFFAEVKTTKEGKEIICCPLQRGENGHCFGCQNVGINLMHPASGGYEEGHENSGFPFDTFSDSDYGL